MTEDEIRAFIAEAPWVFAKSMPEQPHEYTTRAKNAARGAELEFEQVVMHIREVGEKRSYGKARYVYLDLDGYMYWTMGAPLYMTIILNRAVLT